MILLLALPAVMLAGCDKRSEPQGQEKTAASNSAASGDAKADITLESASGMTAVLSYAHHGSAAPSGSFTGADGRDVTLSDFAGRPLLVNIWATWCAPCKAEMPTIDALAEIEAGNMSVIAVSQDLEGRAPVRAFFEQSGIKNLEPYTDTDNMLLSHYQGISLPTTILYDSGGKEVWRVQGGLEWNDEEVAALLREAD
ncbi:TlpA family protein disulfide reductase [Sphingorhabdus arenilitoris]|uniref:TlpA family protein disulfide reductase n=1 Tax=Sphingorhabdus arenilitoris TaxID=1490041 RepID=A0ABV8RFH7_9SPHN